MKFVHQVEETKERKSIEFLKAKKRTKDLISKVFHLSSGTSTLCTILFYLKEGYIPPQSSKYKDAKIDVNFTLSSLDSEISDTLNRIYERYGEKPPSLLEDAKTLLEKIKELSKKEDYRGAFLTCDELYNTLKRFATTKVDSIGPWVIKID
jgi:hypothetical protein